jgi:hypothetical protein
VTARSAGGPGWPAERRMALKAAACSGGSFDEVRVAVPVQDMGKATAAVPAVAVRDEPNAPPAKAGRSSSP